MSRPSPARVMQPTLPASQWLVLVAPNYRVANAIQIAKVPGSPAKRAGKAKAEAPRVNVSSVSHARWKRWLGSSDVGVSSRQCSELLGIPGTRKRLLAGSELAEAELALYRRKQLLSPNRSVVLRRRVVSTRPSERSSFVSGSSPARQVGFGTRELDFSARFAARVFRILEESRRGPGAAGPSPSAVDTNPKRPRWRSFVDTSSHPGNGGCCVGSPISAASPNASSPRGRKG